MANLLKKGKSYLQEVHLETVKSKIHASLSVSLIKGRYQLFTDKVIYSFEDLYKNFRIAANKIDWNVFKPKDILVLGLGLGSVIQIIEKKNKTAMHFTAVDLDETAIYLTHKYTSSKFKSSVEYLLFDAYDYILQNSRKYDLIVIDVFLDDKIPDSVETLQFLKRVKQSLYPNGMVWMNRIAMDPDQILGNMHYLEHVFCKVFINGSFIDVPPNWVLISNKTLIKKKKNLINLIT